MYQSSKQKVKRLDADRLRALERLELDFELLTTAGAVSVTKPVTFFSCAGARAMTLANGYEGQIKICTIKVATGAATMTPANIFTGTTVTFDHAGDTWIGIFQAGHWVTLYASATVA